MAENPVFAPCVRNLSSYFRREDHVCFYLGDGLFGTVFRERGWRGGTPAYVGSCGLFKEWVVFRNDIAYLSFSHIFLEGEG